ncbi:hypothetical protein AXG93_4875s1350 [Marchantia polymorpha subsp. ruderalis]|uniref:Uncharacterized protein n=1 Tax=Marchantia polymorpha subsp. ruderalis TaxID=1480154 RepID=A0A176WPI8_MARPO|nr:hypothetical protein AXG93_4875s1350 [Marchantia polymorpha subsp. ruderalis]
MTTTTAAARRKKSQPVTRRPRVRYVADSTVYCRCALGFITAVLFLLLLPLLLQRRAGHREAEGEGGGRQGPGRRARERAELLALVEPLPPGGRAGEEEEEEEEGGREGGSGYFALRLPSWLLLPSLPHPLVVLVLLQLLMLLMMMQLLH